MRVSSAQFRTLEARLVRAYLKTSAGSPAKALAAWELCQGGPRSKMAALLIRHVGIRPALYHQVSDTDADCFGAASFKFASQAEVPAAGRIPELDRLGAQYVEGKLPLTPDPALDRVMYMVKVEFAGVYWTYRVVFRFPGVEHPLVRQD